MIDIVIDIIKTLVAWIILNKISINLIGLIVRGLLWSPPSIDTPNVALQEYVDKTLQSDRKANFIMTLVPIILAGVYFFVLYRYWNIGLVIAGGLFMVLYLPDLLWEIKTGEKATQRNPPIFSVSTMCNMLFFLSIILVWYSIM